jgi:hypothetical protein
LDGLELLVGRLIELSDLIQLEVAKQAYIGEQ